MAITESNVVVLTYNHSISGRVRLNDQRLSDLLNDHRETVVRVHDATVTRLVHPSKVVDHQKVAVVDKEHLLLVFETAEHKVASSTRPFAFTSKRHFAVFMLVHSIEVSGVLHTSGSLDVLELHRLVAVSGERFLPITDATVALPVFDFKKEAGVLVNVRHIHYIAKLPTPTSDSPGDAQST
jgi:hypothetical protein